MTTSECMACGGMVSNRLSSCPHCGEPFDPRSSQMGLEGQGPLGPNEKFCPACDGRISLSSDNCPKCGTSQMSTAGSPGRFCSACGTQIHAMAEMCPQCGVRQASAGRSRQASSEGAGGLAVCGSFCIPLLGLILYLVWQDSKPEAAKEVCNWTIAGIVILPILWIIFLGAGLSSIF